MLNDKALPAAVGPPAVWSRHFLPTQIRTGHDRVMSSIGDGPPGIDGLRVAVPASKVEILVSYLPHFIVAGSIGVAALLIYRQVDVLFPHRALRFQRLRLDKTEENIRRVKARLLDYNLVLSSTESENSGNEPVETVAILEDRLKACFEEYDMLLHRVTTITSSRSNWAKSSELKVEIRELAGSITELVISTRRTAAATAKAAKLQRSHKADSKAQHIRNFLMQEAARKATKNIPNVFGIGDEGFR